MACDRHGHGSAEMEVDPCLPPAHHAMHHAARQFAPHRLVGRVRAHGHRAIGKISQLRHPAPGCGKRLDSAGQLAARPTDPAAAPVAKAGLLAKIGGAKAASLLGAMSIAGALALAAGDHASGSGAPPSTVDGGRTPGVRPGAPAPLGLPVPEPSSLAMLLAALGLGLIACCGRGRTKPR